MYFLEILLLQNQHLIIAFLVSWQAEFGSCIYLFIFGIAPANYSGTLN